ncbi:MAG: hypothetical protein IJZ03_04945 [Clostridia bacterium]|nr:hypothetical protein [Clostridia bacterium]
MKISLIIFICLTILFSLPACSDNVEFTETENKTIVSADGTEYTFVGNEGRVWCFGEQEFIGHVKGEKKTFVHLTNKIKTGMYSVGGKQDVLIRYFPDNEFAAIYVKSGLLKTEVALDNCIRFDFVKGLLFNNDKTIISKTGITECEDFLNEIKSGQKAKDAGLYDLVKQPDGKLKNCYVYGYVCGVIQEDVNIVILLEVMSFNDKAYSINIDNTEYVLPQEWLDRLTTKSKIDNSSTDSTPVDNNTNIKAELITKVGLPFRLRRTSGMSLWCISISEDSAEREYSNSIEGQLIQKSLIWKIENGELVISGEWSETFTLDLDKMEAISKADGKVYSIVAGDS